MCGPTLSRPLRRSSSGSPTASPPTASPAQSRRSSASSEARRSGRCMPPCTIPKSPPGGLPGLGRVVVGVTARRPAHRALHGRARLGLGSRMLGTVIERHGNVRAQSELYIHGIFGRQPHLPPIDRRAKAHPLLADTPQALEAEDLE